jgi:hypothetical protein
MTVAKWKRITGSLVVAAYVLYALCSVAVAGGVIYIVVHFAQKYW